MQPGCYRSRMKEDRTTQLGCGTLLIIVLIVAFFGNSGMNEMRDRLERIETKIDALRSELRAGTAKK